MRRRYPPPRKSVDRPPLRQSARPCREQLVTIATGSTGRAKEGALTRRGRARIAKALPIWQEAQDAFLEQFGRSAWSTLATNLAEIVDAVRTISAADH